MKNIYWKFASQLVILLMTVGCTFGLHAIRGSGNLTSIEISEEGFTRLDLSNGCEGTVTQGEAYSVVVEIDDNLAEYLKVERHDSTLSIGLKPHHDYRRVSLHVDITMPDIEALEMSGGSELIVTGFSSEHSLSFDLSGGSEVNGDLNSRDLLASLSGGSEVVLQGACQNAKLSGSGGSTFGLKGFKAGDVDVDLSGGSTATVSLDGTLTGDLSGGASVYYIGNPTLGNISKSGGAKVVKAT